MANKPYGSINMNTGEVKVNKSKNKSGLEYLDTATHESVHFNNPRMSEKEVINHTKKLIEGFTVII